MKGINCILATAEWEGFCLASFMRNRQRDEIPANTLCDKKKACNESYPNDS